MGGNSVRLLLALALLAGCDDMTAQRKTTTYAEAAGMPVTPPAGIVDHAPIAKPPALSAALLARGREEYRVFCAPCHAEHGDGRGMIVARGFPAPASFAGQTLDPRDLYRVISDGSGAMYGFAARIAPADRWAIAAHVKALQLMLEDKR